MTDEVFVPLGMRHSTFEWSDSTSLPRVPRFDSDGRPMEYRRFTGLAAAGLYSNTFDLARFVEANLNVNDVLEVGSLNEMFSPHAFINQTGIHALGPTIFARNASGIVIHGHDGSGNLVNTAVRINRITGDAIIVLETGHPNLASSIADHWIFWTTGIADFVVITANKTWIFSLLIGGYLVILIGMIFRKRVKTAAAA